MICKLFTNLLEYTLIYRISFDETNRICVCKSIKTIKLVQASTIACSLSAMLEQQGSTQSTRLSRLARQYRTGRVMSRRAKWNLGLRLLSGCRLKGQGTEMRAKGSTLLIYFSTGVARTNFRYFSSTESARFQNQHRASCWPLAAAINSPAASKMRLTVWNQIKERESNERQTTNSTNTDCLSVCGCSDLVGSWWTSVTQSVWSPVSRLAIE